MTYELISPSESVDDIEEGADVISVSIDNAVNEFVRYSKINGSKLDIIGDMLKVISEGDKKDDKVVHELSKAISGILLQIVEQQKETRKVFDSFMKAFRSISSGLESLKKCSDYKATVKRNFDGDIESVILSEVKG